jgi:hypothetical protein
MYVPHFSWRILYKARAVIENVPVSSGVVAEALLVVVVCHSLCEYCRGYKACDRGVCVGAVRRVRWGGI